MAVPVVEVLKATGGTLVSGPKTARFAALYTDSREVEPGGLFVALKGEQHDGHAYIPQAVERGATGVLCQAPDGVEDGVAVIQVADTRAALVALTVHRLRARALPIVAITGSSGKTTTKDLIAHVLGRRLRVRKSQGNLNTYTGIPMTVFQIEDQDRVLVVEYAMSRAGEIRELAAMAPPSIGVVLNVGLAHVGLLGSIDAVAAAKRELIAGLAPEGIAVLNADDHRVRAMAGLARRAVLYGFARDAAVRAERVRLHGLDGSQFRLKTTRGEADVFLRLPGQHNVSNALAAAAVALEFGFDARAVASALHGFAAPPRRMTVFSGRKGSTVIDDCYNANPASMQAALEVLRIAPRGTTRIAVLGDMLELGNHAEGAHRELGSLAAQSVDHLIALGAHADQVIEGAAAAGMVGGKAIRAQDLQDAIALLEPLLSAHAQVLVKGSRGMRMEAIVAALQESS